MIAFWGWVHGWELAWYLIKDCPTCFASCASILLTTFKNQTSLGLSKNRYPHSFRPKADWIISLFDGHEVARPPFWPIFCFKEMGGVLFSWRTETTNGFSDFSHQHFWMICHLKPHKTTIFGWFWMVLGWFAISPPLTWHKWRDTKRPGWTQLDADGAQRSGAAGGHSQGGTGLPAMDINGRGY